MPPMDDEPNPFRLPPDDQIFLIREQERQKRGEEREKVKTQKVWEKTTASSRVHKNRRVDDGTDDAQLAMQIATKTSSGRADSVGRDARREKENVSDFVAKKREMFLVQMSLDVKKAEILKLDEKAKQKEEALKKSQQMLDEDVTRFDQFLQSNDQKAHKAMKNAEEKTKIKTDKIQKIKHLRSQLSALQSEIAKHREQKDECIKYKTFLEKLTPQEWKDQKAEQKLQRKADRRAAWVAHRMEEYNAKMQAEIEAEERAFEERTQESLKGRRRPKREAEEEAKEREKELETRRRKIRGRYKKVEQVQADFQDVSSGEEMPLYFEESKQLLDVFTGLEESNLFLIQNSQDTQQTLEELQQKFAETRKQAESRMGRMRNDLALKEKQIEEERARAEELRQQMQEKHRSAEQEELLKELSDKVLEVYSACGNDENQGDTLQMLGAIEAKLEEFLAFLDECETTETGAREVKRLEKEKDDERRKRVREYKIRSQNEAIERRLKASLQRSQAPIHKKVGKQIMFRSAPLYQAKKEVDEDDGFEEACNEHGAFGIWINKDGVPNAKPPEKNGA